MKCENNEFLHNVPLNKYDFMEQKNVQVNFQ